jgi:sirohydrochlorin cobaltochelatase
MAEPSLEAALRWAGTAGYRRVVVQPHLLFSGQLADEVRQRVGVAAGRCPSVSWLVARPLGPAPELAELVADAAAEALASWSDEVC